MKRINRKGRVTSEKVDIESVTFYTSILEVMVLNPWDIKMSVLLE